MSEVGSALDDLLRLLDLEPLEVNLFRGNSPKTSWQRVFGGQVIGQAMVAACRTVEGRLPHSLHCYFILPGDPQIPIIYQVERLRDGRSYSTRRVTAIERGISRRHSLSNCGPRGTVYRLCEQRCRSGSTTARNSPG